MNVKDTAKTIIKKLLNMNRAYSYYRIYVYFKDMILVIIEIFLFVCPAFVV